MARSTFGGSRSAVKLEGTLRGTGQLVARDTQLSVSYQLDIFKSDTARTGSGSLDADLTALAGDSTESARLTLSDGFELQVTLSEIDENGAMFEAAEPLPPLRS